jgi:hypothetical protein
MKNTVLHASAAIVGMGYVEELGVVPTARQSACPFLSRARSLAAVQAVALCGLESMQDRGSR